MKENAPSLFDEEFRLDRVRKRDPLQVLRQVGWEGFRCRLDKAFPEVDYSLGDDCPVTG